MPHATAQISSVLSTFTSTSPGAILTIQNQRKIFTDFISQGPDSQK